MDEERDQDWAEVWARRSDADVASSWIDFWSRSHAPDADWTTDKHWWAVDALMGFQHDHPLRALEISFLIARTSDAPRVFEMLGAGPIEDLLADDRTLIDAIALEASASPNLRIALQSVWQGAIPDDVWARLQRIAPA